MKTVNARGIRYGCSQENTAGVIQFYNGARARHGEGWRVGCCRRKIATCTAAVIDILEYRAGDNAGFHLQHYSIKDDQVGSGTYSSRRQRVTRVDKGRRVEGVEVHGVTVSDAEAVDRAVVRVIRRVQRIRQDIAVELQCLATGTEAGVTVPDQDGGLRLRRRRGEDSGKQIILAGVAIQIETVIQHQRLGAYAWVVVDDEQ